MCKLLIGTCGYHYPEDWRGVFYPPGTKQTELLQFYSTQFNALELDFAYHNMPVKAQIKSMVERSGKRIMFSIKANKQLTHEIEVGTWRDVARAYRDALTPFLTDNLLSTVLVQFPQQFHYEDERRRYLAHLLDEFHGLPLVVEFRHDSWQRESVYEGLAQRGVGCCICDMPDLSRLPTFQPVLTGDVAYMRFHGRNSKNWYGTNNRKRYDYLYSDEELAAYVPLLRDISTKAKTVQIFFNNHAKGQAVINARKMMILMAEE